jgi:hypothetical protein
MARDIELAARMSATAQEEIRLEEARIKSGVMTSADTTSH